MQLRTFWLALLLGVSTLACSQEKASYRDQAEAVESSAMEYTAEMEEGADFEQPPMTAQPPPPPTIDPPAPAPERVLLRTADCRLEVENIAEQVKRIEALAARKTGYLGDLKWQHYSYQEEVTMTLRVPAEDFQPTLDEILKLAISVDYQQISTQDVTEEYVDIQSRLKTKKAVRDRYEEILRTKAKTVADIFQAEEQIRRLQEEIEAQEGRLRYLSQRAALSTITLRLYEEVEEQAEAPWWKSFGGEIGDSLKSSIVLLKGLFLGILSIWPLLLIGGLLFWRRKAIWRKLRG